MHAVPFSDLLYAEAELAAKIHDISVEDFIADAVKLHLRDESCEKQWATLTLELVKLIERRRVGTGPVKELTVEQEARTLVVQISARQTLL